MTKKQKHYDRVARLGCVVCALNGNPDTPAELHHIRTGAGMGMKTTFENVIPLCPTHHRTGSYGVAFHQGADKWQENFWTELELLVLVREQLGME